MDRFRTAKRNLQSEYITYELLRVTCGEAGRNHSLSESLMNCFRQGRYKKITKYITYELL